jgi:hypothetical protein
MRVGSPNQITARNAGWTPQFRYRGSHQRPGVRESIVRCDMKLQSVLLGWSGDLTKSCVSPQVLHGSRRRMGDPEKFWGYCPRSEAFPVM